MENPIPKFGEEYGIQIIWRIKLQHLFFNWL